MAESRLKMIDTTNMKVIDQCITDKFALYCGDSCEIMKGIPNNSIGYSIFSPPFADLYTYSNSERDMGNVKGYGMFFEQFKFIISELYRILKDGRSISFHCMQIPAMLERDGYLGIKDFKGDLIREFEKAGFIFHSEVVIWKDPLIEVTRTKAHALMHKQIVKDSYICRQGLPDYLITMRKPGINLEPITHPDGFTDYYGKDEPSVAKFLDELIENEYGDGEKIDVRNVKYSHLVWQKYASPVWMDIRQTNTLNRASAREEQDEKHICPLQLDVIARGCMLWSNEGDTVFTPFAGIGSELYQPILMGRYAMGIELKQQYFNVGVGNCKQAVKQTENEQMRLI